MVVLMFIGQASYTTLDKLPRVQRVSIVCARQPRMRRRYHLRTSSLLRYSYLARRFGPDCYLCGQVIVFIQNDPDQRWRATQDHVLPASQGGPAILGNLRLAHASCNSKRSCDFPRLDIKIMAIIVLLGQSHLNDALMIEGTVQNGTKI